MASCDDDGFAVTPNEWDRLKPLYDRALGLEPGERAAFLERIRLEDEPTALKLSSLIEAGDQTNSLDLPVARLRDILANDAPRHRSFAIGEVVLNRFRIVRF